MIEFDDAMIEQLAEIVHEIWMEAKLKDGWRFNRTTNKDRKEHHSLIPYHTLCESDKQANRDHVKGIPRILDYAGLTIVRKVSKTNRRKRM